MPDEPEPTVPELIVPEPIVIVGGSVAGLATALALARAGHPVTVLERDDVAVEGDADAAFATERRGAPQAHQTHGLLARLRLVLRDRFPDVLDALHEAGAYDMSTTAGLPDVRPGDEDLSVLIVRRTTFEWVLRRAVLAEPSVVHRDGLAVSGVRAVERGGRPHVTGAVLATGEVVPGTVVAATGRRGDVPSWLRAAGVELPEVVGETGFVYLTRWYHLSDAALDEVDARLAGDLGFVKYLAVPGDGGTLSATIAVRSKDDALRAALSDPVAFDAALASLPGPAGFLRAGPMEPIGGVRPMAGLINRIRRFLDAEGQPLVTGLHAVGDAHTCTNPLYGRGCALALVQATLLADALGAHPGDPVGQARAYEAASQREVEPWYHAAVQMDEAGQEMVRTGSSTTSNPLLALFIRGGRDPVVGRALLRVVNLLTRPDELLAEPEVVQRGMELLAEAGDAPLPVPEGPTRDELLALARAAA